MKFVSLFQPRMIWLCVALFYMYQFILRVSPSVMLDDLMFSFHLTASEVGILASVSTYFYSILQIPMGFLIDFYGVRSIAVITLLLCITGTLLFISSNHI